MSMKDFFTKELANEGIEVPLYLPGTNEKSGDWIRIRGIDSDAFRVAEVQSKRELRQSFEDPAKPPAADFHQKAMTKLIASLVISWSFPEECTYENVVEFLGKAPQIEDAINQLAAKRKLFFKNGSTASVNTPEPSSN